MVYHKKKLKNQKRLGLPGILMPIPLERAATPAETPRFVNGIHTLSSGRTTRIECNELSAGLFTFLSPISGKHFKYKFILFV